MVQVYGIYSRVQSDSPKTYMIWFQSPRIHEIHFKWVDRLTTIEIRLSQVLRSMPIADIPLTGLATNRVIRVIA